ncbi:hypothetical protein ACFPLB_09575 [Aquamicrobium segne]|uniref:Uncharacterized protein n=1 Tax=Aquamicrobium segne TaxID=469547 RepID=A0ABW0H0P1_9HYPH
MTAILPHPEREAMPVWAGQFTLIDPLYLAAVEAVEEAVVNAIVAGEDVVSVKLEGKICRTIDTKRLAEIFAE